MPDRYGERDEDDEATEPDRHLAVVPSRTRREERMQARQERIADQQTWAQIREAGIPGCLLCDDDGYTRNGSVCDHVDRTAVYERGRARVRAAMGWSNPTRSAPTGVTASQRHAPGRTSRSAPNPPPEACEDAQRRSHDVRC